VGGLNRENASESHVITSNMYKSIKIKIINYPSLAVKQRTYSGSGYIAEGKGINWRILFVLFIRFY